MNALYDEQDLGSACSFSIATPETDYKFYAETSFDYQKYLFSKYRWVGAFTKAFEQVTLYDVQTNQNFTHTVPITSSPMYNEPLPLQGNTLEWSRDENDYIEVAQRSLARSQEQRRSRSMQRSSQNQSTVYEDYDNNDDYPIENEPKKGILQGMKSFFSRKKSTPNLQERGRRDSFSNSLRRRSKSLVRMFGQ